VCVVTGVSRRAGIGFAGERLLADGARVLAHAWVPHDAEQPWGADAGAPGSVTEALDAGEGRLEHFAADLADPSAVGQVIDRALEAFGGLDVLGGEQRSDVRASLHRLYEADFQLEGYRASAAMTGRLEHPAERGRVRLLSGLHWSEEAPSEQHRAYIGPFIVEQLEAGYLTYLDWRILRALEGLAKRLWVYLESQTFKRSAIGEGAAALQLAPPMLQALGVTTKHAPHARRLLARAGERIAAADKSFVGFELRRPNRRGGTWTLVARRRLTHGGPSAPQ